jgi:hypothetical protein
MARFHACQTLQNPHPQNKPILFLFFFDHIFGLFRESNTNFILEEIMNEKFQEPTLEQLRALLSEHPDLLKHIQSERALDRASREKLLELIDLCGLTIDQVDRSDPFGLLRGLKNKPGKDKPADKSFTHGLLEGNKNSPDYGEDQGYVPFQIAIEALGHKMHYTAFLEYWIAGRAQRYEADNEWILGESSCDTKIKILSYTEEPGRKTSRQSLKKASPVDEILPVILDEPKISELLPEKAITEILDQIEDDLLDQIISEIESPDDQAAKEASSKDNPEPASQKE